MRGKSGGCMCVHGGVWLIRSRSVAVMYLLYGDRYFEVGLKYPAPYSTTVRVVCWLPLF
jgi:hypothetical protein